LDEEVTLNFGSYPQPLLDHEDPKTEKLQQHNSSDLIVPATRPCHCGLQQSGVICSW